MLNFLSALLIILVGDVKKIKIYFLSEVKVVQPEIQIKDGQTLVIRKLKVP